jgi:hypothetical protein
MHLLLIFHTPYARLVTCLACSRSSMRFAGFGKDGRPRVPCASQQWKRGNRAGAPLPEALFVLTVLTALRHRLIGARDLIIDSVPILAAASC